MLSYMLRVVRAFRLYYVAKIVPSSVGFASEFCSGKHLVPQELR